MMEMQWITYVNVFALLLLKANLYNGYSPVVQNLLSMEEALGASQESQTILFS